MIPNPPLLVITDRQQAVLPLPELLERCLGAGCRWFSLREKDMSAEQRRDLVLTLRPMFRRNGATLTVHEDLAAAALADGVHLPDGVDALAARQQLGQSALIGQSRHQPGPQPQAADYACLGPIFPTPSKPGYGPALGTAALGQGTGRVLALGGVTAQNAAACLAAGAAGIAVMGSVMRAEQPETVISELLKSLRTA